MGLRGPKPKPTAQKIAEGNRGRRPLPENEPQPRRVEVLPPAPLSLEGPGEEMWYDLGEKLIRDRVLADTHLHSLELLCDAWFRLLVLRDDLRENGYTQLLPIVDGKGEVVGERERARPQVALLKDALADYKRWNAEFGLTPASSPRVQTLPEDWKEKKGKEKDAALALMEELEKGIEGQGDGAAN